MAVPKFDAQSKLFQLV